MYSLTDTEVPYVTPIIGENDDANLDFIVLGGMSGVGAKGAMTYGLIASHWLLGKTENGEMYGKVREELGYERLLRDAKTLE